MVFVATNEEISLAFCAAETFFEGNSIDLVDDEGEQSDIGAEAKESNCKKSCWKRSEETDTSTFKQAFTKFQKVYRSL